jgi:glycosyltransferase involved in cell wall biosynthesis
MKSKTLIVLANEKVCEYDKNFYCERHDEKSIPEGLSKYNNTYYLVRNSNKKGKHKINGVNIIISKNFISFLLAVIKTLKISDANYLLISINPLTFFSFIVLFFFKKKVFVYLRSSGHEEYKYILGSWAVKLYDIMFKIVTSSSRVLVCDYRLYNKDKSYLVLPSKLDDRWLRKQKPIILDKIRFLYVGRINPEKGILKFIEMFKELKLDATLSIVSENKISELPKNIKFLGHGFDTETLINIYDDHNIMILPSFTEGHPQVVIESLSRRRPVIIFEEISHVVKNRKGIFISKRNKIDFSKTVEHIIKNYKKIQDEMDENKLPTKDEFFFKISEILKVN